MKNETERGGISTETVELIGYCGVDCAACPDYGGGVCPGCRKSTWPDGDACPPIACCREKNIDLCGRCLRFPCAMMAEFYGESEGHRKAYERMSGLRTEELP